MKPEMPDLSLFIGRPYSEVNCWQLVCEFYRKVYGVELSYYATKDPESKEQVHDLIQAHLNDFVPVAEPGFGDIMLIKIMGIQSHIGIYLGSGRFLHSSRTTGSVIDSVAKWSPRITGYYRSRILEA